MVAVHVDLDSYLSTVWPDRRIDPMEMGRFFCFGTSSCFLLSAIRGTTKLL